jgi:hypothetical protein
LKLLREYSVLFIYVGMSFFVGCTDFKSAPNSDELLTSDNFDILSPSNNSLVNSVSHIISGTCTLGTLLSITGDIIGGPVGVSCVGATLYSQSITLTSGDGTKNILMNVQGQPEGLSLVINLDTTAPSAPTILSHSNGATISTTVQTITGACESGATVIVSGAISSSPVTAICAGSAYSKSVAITGADGSKSISVSQRDLAGNTSSLRTISLTLNSTVPAAPTITSPANGARTNSLSATVSGACLTGTTISISGQISGSPVTTTCTSSAYSRGVSLVSGDGSKSINVTQSNGNVSPQATVSITLDTAAPTMPTITSPVSGSTITALAQTVTGVCESSALMALSGSITGSPLTTTCSGGSYSRAVTFTSGNGSKNLSVSQQDQAGNTSATRSITLNLDIASGNPNWTPVNSTRLLISGHSLTDNPLADYLVDITSKTSDSFNYNQQISIGSPLRVRTKGNDPGVSGFPGYSLGKNKGGSSGLNLINEVRNPATLGVGEQYNTLVVTENHSSLGQIQWENTVEYLRQYHDLMISGNAATRTFFFHSWLDVNKSDPTAWITYETHAATTWECVASKVNEGLQLAGRSDRIRLLPAGGALVDLVNRVVADQVPEITGTTTAKLNMVFNDNVHLTSLGMYYISLVVYASTYGKNPYGINPPSGSGISATLAGNLQTIAWNYVNAYYNQGSDPSARTMSSCRTFISNNSCTSYWTQLGQTNNIPGCQSFFGTNGGDNPFRDAALTPLPVP